MTLFLGLSPHFVLHRKKPNDANLPGTWPFQKKYVKLLPYREHAYQELKVENQFDSVQKQL